MAFTYQGGANPQIDYIRLLIPDTDPTQPIFDDTEIESFYQIQASVFQSGMFFSGQQGRNLPGTPVDYYRVAALALDVMANNKAKLGAVSKLLDVSLQDIGKLVDAIRSGARAYREQSDDAGSFMIIEQTNTDWSFRDRWWKQWQRQSAGAGLIGG